MIGKRIHVKNYKGKRTTINLHETLYELLVISLGQQPNTKAGDKAVKQWLEDELKVDNGIAHGKSWQIQQLAMFQIADQRYVDKWVDNLEVNDLDQMDLLEKRG